MTQFFRCPLGVFYIRIIPKMDKVFFHKMQIDFGFKHHILSYHINAVGIVCQLVSHTFAKPKIMQGKQFIWYVKDTLKWNEGFLKAGRSQILSQYDHSGLELGL